MVCDNDYIAPLSLVSSVVPIPISSSSHRSGIPVTATATLQQTTVVSASSLIVVIICFKKIIQPYFAVCGFV